MLKVWGRQTSINVQKVMWLVGELGLEYERIDVGGPFGGLDRPDYTAMNPTSRIPTVEDGGFTLWESNAIVRYLAQKHGDGSWWPDDPRMRAVADQWMDWPGNLAYQHLIRAFIGLYRTPEDERDDDAIVRSLETCATELAVLDSRLADNAYVAGDTLTMGDVPAGCIAYRWHAMDIERPELPNLAAWYGRLRERSAFREHAMIPLS